MSTAKGKETSSKRHMLHLVDSDAAQGLMALSRTALGAVLLKLVQLVLAEREHFLRLPDVPASDWAGWTAVAEHVGLEIGADGGDLVNKLRNSVVEYLSRTGSEHRSVRDLELPLNAAGARPSSDGSLRLWLPDAAPTELAGEVGGSGGQPSAAQEAAAVAQAPAGPPQAPPATPTPAAAPSPAPALPPERSPAQAPGSSLGSPPAAAPALPFNPTQLIGSDPEALVMCEAPAIVGVVRKRELKRNRRREVFYTVRFEGLGPEEDAEYEARKLAREHPHGQRVIDEFEAQLAAEQAGHAAPVAPGLLPPAPAAAAASLVPLPVVEVAAAPEAPAMPFVEVAAVAVGQTHAVQADTSPVGAAEAGGQPGPASAATAHAARGSGGPARADPLPPLPPRLAGLPLRSAAPTPPRSDRRGKQTMKDLVYRIAMARAGEACAMSALPPPPGVLPLREAADEPLPEPQPGQGPRPEPAALHDQLLTQPPGVAGDDSQQLGDVGAAAHSGADVASPSAAAPPQRSSGGLISNLIALLSPGKSRRVAGVGTAADAAAPQGVSNGGMAAVAPAAPQGAGIGEAAAAAASPRGAGGGEGAAVVAAPQAEAAGAAAPSAVQGPAPGKVVPRRVTRAARAAKLQSEQEAARPASPSVYQTPVGSTANGDPNASDTPSRSTRSRKRRADAADESAAAQDGEWKDAVIKSAEQVGDIVMVTVTFADGQVLQVDTSTLATPLQLHKLRRFYERRIVPSKSKRRKSQPTR